jgi:flagellar hook-basal body complex protein FliE
MDAINKITAVNSHIVPSKALKATDEDSSESFGRILKNSINEVNKLQNQADKSIERLATGEEKDIHNTMITIQKAQISFELMTQIQNRLLSAYDELRRIQI